MALNPYFKFQSTEQDVVETNIIEIIRMMGKNIYYIEGTSKILRDEDIKSMKSKSALEAEEDQDDDSSEEEKLRIERDFSEEKN